MCRFCGIGHCCSIPDSIHPRPTFEYDAAFLSREVMQMNAKAKAIVTIHFRDGSLERRHSWVGLHVDKDESSASVTIDGRSYSYSNVTTIDVSSAGT